MKKHNSSNFLPLEDINITINPFKVDLIPSEYENQLKEMTCPICISLVFNPVHCKKCTNLICKSCIDAWLLKSPNCPLCNEEFFPNEPVNFVKNSLSQIKSKCLNSKPTQESDETPSEDSNLNYGCQMLIRYNDYESHIRACDFRPYTCTTCNTKCLRKEMLEHEKTCFKRRKSLEQENSLDFNSDECMFCKKKISKILLGSHESECELRKLQCENCKATFTEESSFKKHSGDIKECINYFNQENIKLLNKKDNEIHSLADENYILKSEIARLKNRKYSLEDEENKQIGVGKNGLVESMNSENQGKDYLIKDLRKEINKFELERKELKKLIEQERLKVKQLQQGQGLGLVQVIGQGQQGQGLSLVQGQSKAQANPKVQPQLKNVQNLQINSQISSPFVQKVKSNNSSNKADYDKIFKNYYNLKV